MVLILTNADKINLLLIYRVPVYRVSWYISFDPTVAFLNLNNYSKLPEDATFSTGGSRSNFKCKYFFYSRV
jgi:hypothetical protein